MRVFDYGKLKEQKWDYSVVSLLSSIHELKGKQGAILTQKRDTLDRLVHVATIQSTESSNKIEGIVTTHARIVQLCEGTATPRNRDEEQILGYRVALDAVIESHDDIALSPLNILSLHKLMYSEVTGDSVGGRYKNGQNQIIQINPDGTKTVLFTPMIPFDTPRALEEACDSFNRVTASHEVNPLLALPTFIFDFLCIHPFDDGNGRMSRLLTTLLLCHSGCFVGKYISLEKLIEENRDLYYDALRECNAGWENGTNDYTPFVRYLLTVIYAAYRELENRANIVEGKKKSEEMVRDAINDTLGKFRSGDIMERVPQIGRASVLNYLQKLVAEGVIEKLGKGKNTFYVKK